MTHIYTVLYRHVVHTVPPCIMCPNATKPCPCTTHSWKTFRLQAPAGGFHHCAYLCRVNPFCAGINIIVWISAVRAQHGTFTRGTYLHVLCAHMLLSHLLVPHIPEERFGFRLLLRALITVLTRAVLESISLCVCFGVYCSSHVFPSRCGCVIAEYVFIVYCASIVYVLILRCIHYQFSCYHRHHILCASMYEIIANSLCEFMLCASIYEVISHSLCEFILCTSLYEVIPNSLCEFIPCASLYEVILNSLCEFISHSCADLRCCAILCSVVQFEYICGSRSSLCMCALCIYKCYTLSK